MFDRKQRVIVSTDRQRRGSVRLPFDDSLNPRVGVAMFVRGFVAGGRYARPHSEQRLQSKIVAIRDLMGITATWAREN